LRHRDILLYNWFIFVPAVEEDIPMWFALAVKLFCKLRFGSSKLLLSVYRVIDKDKKACFIIFENVHLKRYITRSYVYVESTEAAKDQSVCDLFLAVDRLKIEMPLSINSIDWMNEGTGSLDNAIEKFEIFLTEQPSSIKTPDVPVEENATGLSAYTSITENESNDSITNEEVLRFSKKLRSLTRGKSVYWQPISSSMPARNYEILVIDDAKVHQVP
jgi:hypothetical protein